MRAKQHSELMTRLTRVKLLAKIKEIGSLLTARLPLTQGFAIKEVGGKLFWFGTPTNNAQDRDDEWISEKALRDDVARTSSEKDDSELLYAHLDGSARKKGIKIRLGGPPLFRHVVSGFLVEAGEIDDTPIAKQIARHIMRNPEGPDGSGWGMSQGFDGWRDRRGVFHAITMKERSVLPLSRAANPYTSFVSRGEKQVGAVDKSLYDAVDELMDMLSDSGDPLLLDHMDNALSAKRKSLKLDEQRVTRKEKAVKPSVTKAKAPKPKPEDDEEDDPDVDDDEDEEPVGRKAKAKSEPTGLTKTEIADIARYIEEKENKFAAEVNKALKNLVKITDDLTERMGAFESGEKQLRRHNEAPRSLFDQLSAQSARVSKEAELDDEEFEDFHLKEDLDEDDDEISASLGLRKKR